MMFVNCPNCNYENRIEKGIKQICDRCLTKYEIMNFSGFVGEVGTAKDDTMSCFFNKMKENKEFRKFIEEIFEYEN